MNVIFNILLVVAMMAVDALIIVTVIEFWKFMQRK